MMAAETGGWEAKVKSRIRTEFCELSLSSLFGLKGELTVV